MELASDTVASLRVGATGMEESPFKVQLRLHATLIELQEENEIFDEKTYP